MTKPPSCTNCGRELSAHCTRCAWWRCTNHACHVVLHDFTRGMRTLKDGRVERFVEQG